VKDGAEKKNRIITYCREGKKDHLEEREQPLGKKLRVAKKIGLRAMKPFSQ